MIHRTGGHRVARAVCAAVLAVVCLPSGALLAQTPLFSLRAVEINDVPVPQATQQDLPQGMVHPGDIVRVEAYVESWDDQPNRGVCNDGSPCTGVGSQFGCLGKKHCTGTNRPCTVNADCANNQCVQDSCVAGPVAGAFQWVIDCTSFSSGLSGKFEATVIPCDPADCVILYEGTCPCGQFYPSFALCTCVIDDPCQADGTCTSQASGFIELARPDYMMVGRSTVRGVNTSSCDYEYGAAILDTLMGGVVDPGARRYIGTLLLTASADALGTFTIKMDKNSRRTFLQDVQGIVLAPASFQPLVIHMPPLPFPICNDGNPCTTDALLPDSCEFFDNTGPCNDDDPCTLNDVCTHGTCTGVPLGCPVGQACNTDNGLCENTGCRRMVAGSFPNCAIDARQPHEPHDDSHGLGFAQVTLAFDGSCAFCGDDSTDYSIETVPTTAAPPGISSVSCFGNGGVAIINLTRPIPPGAWTCVTHNASGDSVCLGSLPGDVNGDRLSNTGDLLALIDSLNHVPGRARPTYATDIDRSGATGAKDIARWIDLFNGADAFDPWLSASLPLCPSAP